MGTGNTLLEITLQWSSNPSIRVGWGGGVLILHSASLHWNRISKGHVHLNGLKHSINFVCGWSCQGDWLLPSWKIIPQCYHIILPKNEDNSGRLVDYPVIPAYINSTMLTKVQCQIRYFLYHIFVPNFVVQKSENVPKLEVQFAAHLVCKPAENSTFFVLRRHPP